MTPHTPHERGVTLVELLVASSMAAILLLALAQTVQVFGEQVAYAKASEIDEMVLVGDAIASDVRSAWLVSQPSASALEVQDAFGDVTSYAFVDGALRVTRPSGASGALLEGLAACTFDVETIPRYREAPAVDVDDAWYTTWGAGGSNAIILQPGQMVGVALMPSSEAPAGVSTVEGVTERRTSARIEELIMVIDKIDLSDHVFWHLYDTPPDGSTDIGSLTITLYESRGPGSAIPHGPALASTSTHLSAFPTNGYYWLDETTGEVVDPPNGAAYGWWKNNPDVVLVVTIPTSAYAADISGLDAVVEPGRSYVLTFETDDWGAIIISTRQYGRDEEASSFTPDSATTPLSETTEVVPFSLLGPSTYTQTEQHDVVNRVTVSFTRDDGSTHTASAAVLGHAAATDPWVGAAPGELPTLQSP